MEHRPDIRPVLGSGPIDAARRYKDEAERDALRRASKINDIVVETAIGALADGAVEAELAALVNRTYLQNGADVSDGPQLVCFGANAADPHHAPGHDTVKSGDSGFFWIGSQPWLKVNADGRRFMNESGTYENILHADEYQKGHCHYTIFDSNWVKYAEQFKMHGCSRLFPFENGA